MAHVPRKTALPAVLITAWLVLAVVFAGVFVIVEQRHDHTGESCRVCLEIQISLRLIEALARIGAAFFVAGFIASAARTSGARVPVFAAKPPASRARLIC